MKKLWSFLDSDNDVIHPDWGQRWRKQGRVSTSMKTDHYIGHFELYAKFLETKHFFKELMSKPKHHVFMLVVWIWQDIFYLESDNILRQRHSEFLQSKEKIGKHDRNDREWFCSRIKIDLLEKNSSLKNEIGKKVFWQFRKQPFDFLYVEYLLMC